MRKRAKDKFKAQVLEQLHQYDKVQFKQVKVRAETNLGYDIDNCIMSVKFAMDAFKEWGGIADDNKKHFPKVTLEHNPSIQKDTTKIFFYGSVVLCE